MEVCLSLKTPSYSWRTCEDRNYYDKHTIYYVLYLYKFYWTGHFYYIGLTPYVHITLNK